MSESHDAAAATAGADPSEILAFLDTAPESVREWAEQQAQQVKKAREPQRTPSPPAAPLDDNEVALAELDEIEEEVPVFRRRARRREQRSAAAASAAPSQQGGYSDRRVILVSLVVALVVGIGSGAYFSNQSSQNLATAQQMQMPDGHPEIAEDDSISVAQLAELEARVKADPDDAEALMQLGAMRFDSGEIDAAEEHWNSVLAIDPDAIDAHYSLGFAYLASDPPRPEEAVQSWNRVIEIDPDSELAENVTMHLAAIASEIEADSGDSEDDGP